MGDFFIPLGGGNEIGASSYFLSIDGVNILLDCGARNKGEELYPDYGRLLRDIVDYSAIDLIIISHGHYDHIGSLARIAALAPNAMIMATVETKRLISMQLLDFGRISGRAESDKVKNERYRLAQAIMARIQDKPVSETLNIKGCKIKLLPAGHMIGAVMVYIESANHRVLYSGDFSTKTMFGLNGMEITSDVTPDILLLNAPNTYLDSEQWNIQFSQLGNPMYQSNHYTWLESNIKQNLETEKTVYIFSRSIPKHLDLLYFLKNMFPDVPVYIDKPSRVIADALANMGYSVYGDNIQAPDAVPAGKCIIVGQETSKPGCMCISFDNYSLHASAAEVYEFTKKVNAKNVYLLHVYPSSVKKSLIDLCNRSGGDITVTQAENGVKYYLKKGKIMKYINLYNETMQKEMRRSCKPTGWRKAQRNEWAAIFGSFLYVDQHPQKAFDALKEKYFKKSGISYMDYIDALKSANLDSEEKRKYALGFVERGVEVLKQALDGDKSALEKYSKFLENLEVADEKSHKRFFIGKFMVIFMILIDPDLKDEKYMPIALSYGEGYSSKLLEDLCYRLMAQCGVSRKKTAKDVLKKTEKAISSSSEEAYFSTDGESEIERLRFMNDNYKNTLELVQATLDELQDTIDETASEAKNAAIASFYSNMNSEKYGSLLDSIELVDKRLAEIKRDREKIPPRLLPLTIIFKQLIRFIKDCGITPIDITGREFETEVDGLENYIYVGDAYTEPGEKKTVQVERPGWKFNSTVISLPTVREKENEGSSN